jgi:hypothetical protein
MINRVLTNKPNLRRGELPLNPSPLSTQVFCCLMSPSQSKTQPGSRKPTYEAATKSRPSPGHNLHRDRTVPHRWPPLLGLRRVTEPQSPRMPQPATVTTVACWRHRTSRAGLSRLRAHISSISRGPSRRCPSRSEAALKPRPRGNPGNIANTQRGPGSNGAPCSIRADVTALPLVHAGAGAP